MKGAYVFAVAGLILFSSLLLYLATSPDQDALAREYKCPTEGGFGLTAKEITEKEYENKIFAFNSGVESRSGSIEELNGGYVQEGGVVTELNQIANCLVKEHGVKDLDSVAVISDKGQAVLSYDMERLVQVAPSLAKYATVPEFGPLVSATMIVSVLGAVLIHKKFRT